MTNIRKQYPVFGEASTEIIELGNDHVFVYKKTLAGHANKPDSRLFIVYNFSESIQSSKHQMLLAPYQVLWPIGN